MVGWLIYSSRVRRRFKSLTLELLVEEGGLVYPVVPSRGRRGRGGVEEEVEERRGGEGRVYIYIDRVEERRGEERSSASPQEAARPDETIRIY